MAFQYAFKRMRPSRIGDGQGGFTEQLGAGVAFYGSMEIDSNATTLLVDAHEDIVVGDFVGIMEGANAKPDYRVLSSQRVPGTAWKRLGLENVSRPISKSPIP